MMSGESLSSREIKVVIGSPSHVSERKAISFAKKATKHIRIGRRWSFVNANVSPFNLPSYRNWEHPTKARAVLPRG